MQISFGDNVKILENEETKKLGIAGKKGQVYGETTPSVTEVEVIGKQKDDFALNVFIDEIEKDFWFAPELLEFIDHAPGTEIKIGEHTSTRNADGSWNNEVSPKKPWWRFWQ